MSRVRSVLSYAIRDASRHRVILVLIIVSLSVSAISVYVTSSILDGFKETLTRGAVDSNGHLIITPNEDRSHIDNLDHVTSALTTIDNIEGYSVRTAGIGGIKIKERVVAAYAFMGFDERYEGTSTNIPNTIVDGKFFSASDKKEVVLGLDLADALVGLDSDGQRVAANTEVEVVVNGKVEKYTVVGIVDAKTFYANWTAFFYKNNLEALDSSKKNSEIVIKLKDPQKIDETKQQIIGKNLSVQVSTWKQRAGYIEDILKAVSFITDLISGLLIVVIFFIVSIIVFINISQKKRQIGIMKSMGASNSFIIWIYLIETFVYSIFAFIIGFLIFMLIHLFSEAHPISLLIGDFHTALNQSNLIRTTIILFIASIGGSFVPGYMAAKTKIVDIINDRS